MKQISINSMKEIITGFTHYFRTKVVNDVTFDNEVLLIAIEFVVNQYK